MTYYSNVLKRYLQPGETSLNDVFHRVSKNLKSDFLPEEYIFKLLSQLIFLPNSPTLANIGTPHGGCSACYVLPLEDSVKGIYKTAYEQATVHAAFGGTGFDLTPIRAKGSRISSSTGEACGPCAVLEFLNQSAHLIRQGGKREGANMGILYDDHPDLEEFISYKDNRPYLKHFNTSVGVHTSDVGNTERDDLLYRIAKHSHATGDPGVIFVDRLNDNNEHMDTFGPIRATNPCITGRHIIATKNGLKRMHDIRIGDQIWVGPSEFETVIKTFNIGSKPVYRVTTNRGYTIEGTSDHKLCTTSGLVCIGDLKIGDVLECQVNGYLPDGGNFNEGYLAGVIFGDGWISCNRVGISGSVDDYEEFVELTKYINEMYDTNLTVRTYVQRSGNNVLRIMTGKKLFYKFGKKVKNIDWCVKHTKEWLRGFVSGWLFADGHIEQGNSNSIAISSSSKDNLDVLASILLQFGILVSNIYEVKRKGHESDGLYGFNTSENTYSYRLQIAGEFKHKLVDEFVMSGSIKRNMNFKNKSISRKGTSNQCVVSIEYIGEDNVYDFTTDGNKLFYANGIRNLDCGEQPLRPYECCNLGSINLTRFVKDGEFDFYAFEQTVDMCVRILDKIIDVSNYPLGDIRIATLRSRKIGLGIMGWADTLILLGIPYCSYEAINLIHDIGSDLRNTAFSTSIDLAEQFSPYTSGHRRNENLITIAPTGTLSYFAGCSSGIEPNFSWETIRETEAGLTVIKHPLYDKYIKGTDLENDIAHSIDASWHVKHQSTWQIYVDNAVSKTINFPHDATIEDVHAAYRLAYEQGCKGITIYRDGSKTQQTLRTKEPTSSRERPATVYERKSGCGTIYVIPSVMPGSLSPWDTFAVTSGGCAANSEAIGRLISGWLQDPIPDEGVPTRISRILHRVDCPKCSRRDGCDGKSCADIIGRVIVEHFLSKQTDDRPTCPSCGQHLNFGSGCNQGECPSCGWSGCN